MVFLDSITVLFFLVCLKALFAVSFTVSSQFTDSCRFLGHISVYWQLFLYRCHLKSLVAVSFLVFSPGNCVSRSRLDFQNLINYEHHSLLETNRKSIGFGLKCRFRSSLKFRNSWRKISKLYLYYNLATCVFAARYVIDCRMFLSWVCTVER